MTKYEQLQYQQKAGEQVLKAQKEAFEAYVEPYRRQLTELFLPNIKKTEIPYDTYPSMQESAKYGVALQRANAILEQATQTKLILDSFLRDESSCGP